MAPTYKLVLKEREGYREVERGGTDVHKDQDGVKQATSLFITAGALAQHMA